MQSQFAVATLSLLVSFGRLTGGLAEDAKPPEKSNLINYDGIKETGFTVKVVPDMPYKHGENLSDDEKQFCKLDLYLPTGEKNFTAIVWVHGGALMGGDKAGDDFLGRSLAKTGLAVVSVNYRLAPKAKYPTYIQDVATAFAWTHAHIADYGGDPDNLFLCGHSAGGYLALITGLDEHYLREVGIDPSAIAGIVSLSGQTMSPIAVKKERGVGEFTGVADDSAPVHYVRKHTPPLLLLYGDHDAMARAEENAYLVALMNGAGNMSVSGKLIPECTHGSIYWRLAKENDAVRLATIEFINAQSKALSGQSPPAPAIPHKNSKISR